MCREISLVPRGPNRINHSTPPYLVEVTVRETSRPSDLGMPELKEDQQPVIDHSQVQLVSIAAEVKILGPGILRR